MDWIILTTNNQSCTYFALDLPWLGNGRQVTTGHHHCPVWNQTTRLQTLNSIFPQV